MSIEGNLFVFKQANRSIKIMLLIENANSLLENIRLQQISSLTFTKRGLASCEKTSEKLPEDKMLQIEKAFTTTQWKEAFAKTQPINTVISLEVDLNWANWNQEILDLVVSKIPRLQDLFIMVDPLKQESINLAFTELTSLKINIRKRNQTPALEIKGCLPKLKNFQITYYGKTKLNAESLGALLVSAIRTLSRITIFSYYGWQIAEKLGKVLHAKSPLPDICLTVQQATHYANSLSDSGIDYSNDTENLYLKDWQAFSNLRSLGFEIDITSIIPLVDCLERFNQVKDYLEPRVSNLVLQSQQHNFLIKEPELLKGFEQVESLVIFSANSLTRDGFVWFTTNLPKLKEITLFNNHNPEFSILDLQSDTLISLVLTHFHQLKDYQINCPSLEKLELDNCSENTENYPTINGEVFSWCNGNFGERFLADLLNGASNINLPKLKDLYIWHNQNSLGLPLVLEPLRIEINCSAGHPTLQELVLSRLSHIKILRLKHLPKLRRFAMWDDFEKGQGWLEELDISELQKDCVIEIDCISDKPKIGNPL